MKLQLILRKYGLSAACFIIPHMFTEKKYSGLFDVLEVNKKYELEIKKIEETEEVK